MIRTQRQTMKRSIQQPLLLCALISMRLAAALAAPLEPASESQRKAAIIVENRAGTAFNDKVTVLEDLLGSRIAGEGFSVISRDTVTRSLQDYRSGNAAVPTNLDRELEANTTALRLAQTLGADYIIIPSITSYGAEQKTYRGNGIATLSTLHTLRVGYKVVEAAEGGAVRGDTVVSTKPIRQTEGLQVEDTDVINQLLDDAARQLAASVVRLNAPGGRILPTNVAMAKPVTITISCSMTDAKDQPIVIPEVQVSKEGEVTRTGRSLEAQPLQVTVELDGAVVGSAPGKLEVRPGLHKLRLTREGFTNWERTVNVFAGQNLNVALQMTEANHLRWRDNMAFLQSLENGRRLTEAQAKHLEGIGKYWSESHYRVDTRENLRIYKSLF